MMEIAVMSQTVSMIQEAIAEVDNVVEGPTNNEVCMFVHVCTCACMLQQGLIDPSKRRGRGHASLHTCKV